jgi:hypothetical protein
MATGISSSFTPRKEAQELGGLTIKGDAPSVGINSFSRGVNVTPQQAVQFGAPYVSTQQTANFIQSLGQFNDSIRSFGISYNKYDTEQNALQGEADAATIDPAERARLFNEFRGNVDSAVEAGILPKSMHPVYRMNLMQNLAKNQVAQDLPSLLEQERLSLTDAGATDIGGKLAKKANDYVTSTYQDPLSRVAASKAAEPLVLNHQNQYQAEHNANFDKRYFESKDTDLLNTLDQIHQVANNGGDENLIPSLLGNLSRKELGDKDPNGRIGKALEVFVKNSTDSGVPPDQVKKVIDLIENNVNTGTGLWAKTSSGREAITTSTDHLISYSSKMATLHREQRNDDYKTIELQAEADINAAARDGKLISRENVNQLAAVLHQKYPTIDKNVILLKVDTANKTVNNAAASEKSRPDLVSKIENQIQSNPREAKYSIDYYRKTKAGITPDTLDELEKKANAADDEIKLATDNDGYKKLDQTIKDNVLPLFATKGGMSGLSEVDTKANAQKRDTVIRSVDSFGRTAVQAAVRKTMDEDMAGPNLRQTNPAAFKVKLNQNIDDAIKRTTDFGLKMGDSAQKDKNLQTDSEELGPYTAPITSIADTVKEINAKSPTDLTVEDKIALQRIPEYKRDLLNDLRYGTSDKQKKQAALAYSLLHVYTGYSPDAIISGKDEYGVPVEKKAIDSKNGLFFQNEQQYNDVMSEFNAVKKAGGDVAQTKIAKMFKALDVPKEEQQRFITAQQYYIAKRRIPSFQEIVTDPSYPSGTKVDSGAVSPSRANPYPQAAAPVTQAPAQPKPAVAPSAPQANAAPSPQAPKISEDNPFKSELDKDVVAQEKLRSALQAKAAKDLQAIQDRQNTRDAANVQRERAINIENWGSQLKAVTESMDKIKTKTGNKKKLATEWETLNTRKTELEALIAKNKK